MHQLRPQSAPHTINLPLLLVMLRALLWRTPCRGDTTTPPPPRLLVLDSPDPTEGPYLLLDRHHDGDGCPPGELSVEVHSYSDHHCSCLHDTGTPDLHGDRPAPQGTAVHLAPIFRHRGGNPTAGADFLDRPVSPSGGETPRRVLGLLVKQEMPGGPRYLLLDGPTAVASAPSIFDLGAELAGRKWTRRRMRVMVNRDLLCRLDVVRNVGESRGEFIRQAIRAEMARRFTEDMADLQALDGEGVDHVA